MARSLPIQPLIAPLFGGVTELEVLARHRGFKHDRQLLDGS